jgi:hypothetical protein
MACPTGAITSFPLQIAITATDTLYDSVNEPITMDFQWAARSTPPMFTTPKSDCITDEVGAGNANRTTLRYNNVSYTVASVQIINASHTAWILPNTLQDKNKEDIVITFNTESSTTSTKYITFVIPIIRNANGTSEYLAGLSDPNKNGPFSLQSCFPTNPAARFIYYATCLAPYSGSSSSQNSFIFVSVDGINVATDLILKILGITGLTDKFGNFRPPFSTRLTTNLTRIASVSDFTTRVMTTNQILNYAGFNEQYKSDADVRKDDTSAYQCVPIDPDTAVVDGKLQVDLKTGEALNTVLAGRDAMRAAHGVKTGMDPGRLEKYMGSAVGILLSIILFAGILWFTLIFFLSDRADPNSFYQNLPGDMILTLIIGFIGFIIGVMLN